MALPFRELNSYLYEPLSRLVITKVPIQKQKFVTTVVKIELNAVNSNLNRHYKQKKPQFPVVQFDKT
jgi:hypothetical protein